MKKNFRIAALALAVCGLMTACNNNAPAELVDTVIPVDTTVVEEIIDSLPVVDTPVVEQPVVTKSTPKKKATTKKASNETKTVQLTTLQGKNKKRLEDANLKDAKEIPEGGVKTKTLNPNGKPSLTDALKKNN